MTLPSSALTLRRDLTLPALNAPAASDCSPESFTLSALLRLADVERPRGAVGKTATAVPATNNQSVRSVRRVNSLEFPRVSLGASAYGFTLCPWARQVMEHSMNMETTVFRQPRHQKGRRLDAQTPNFTPRRAK